jgi:hypothetical protein
LRAIEQELAVVDLPFTSQPHKAPSDAAVVPAGVKMP